MPYKMTVDEKDVFGINKYLSSLTGKTECVAFVQAVTGAGLTRTWRQGARIWGAPENTIEQYTAIATFDLQGRYPTDDKGKHAAIYISHDQHHILVLDQWASQKEVKRRKIPFICKDGTKRSNDGKTFYVIA